MAPVAIGFTVLAGRASSQEAAPAASQPVVLENVVVTAQKREQNPQDIGISVAAVEGSQVSRLDLISPSQVPNQIANVNLAQPNGTGAFSFSIRGVTQNDFADHEESPTAIYVDDAYVSQMAGLAFQLFDVDRIEVSRGPQGTLFGRNATGGIAQFFSRRPTSETTGYLQATYGSYNRVSTEGALGGALDSSKKITGRVSFATNRRDSLFKNPNGGPGLENANEQAARGQVRIEFSDTASLLAIGRLGHQDVRAGAWESVPSAAGPDGYGYFSGDKNALGYGPSGDFSTIGDAAGYAKIDTSGLTLKLEAEVASLGAKLTGLVDYQHLKKDYLEDSDTTPLNYFHFFNSSRVNQYSSEVRLNGDKGAVKWISGLYYLDIDGAYTEGAQGSVYGGLFDPYTLRTKSYAAFGQIEAPIATDLTFVAGARYTEDRKAFDYKASYPGFSFAFGPESVGKLSNLNDGFWTGRLGFDYKVAKHSLVYVSYNLGAKAGGFNAPLDPGVSPDPSTIPFKRETLNSYEVGFKTELLEKRLRINSSLFYYDYKDNQALHFINLTQLISNAAARHTGGEIEVQLAATRTFLLGGGVGYTDAVVKSIDLNGLGARDYIPANAPKFTANAFARYSDHVADGFLVLQADGNYVSSQYFALTDAANTRQAGYGIGNLRASFTTKNNRWEYAFAVENVFDKHYAVMGFDLAGFLGLAQRYPGKPRTLQATVGYHF